MNTPRNTAWDGHRLAFPPNMRRRILARQPICAHCHQAPSTIADHRIPIGEGGAHDESNGQGLCASCHDAKTRAERLRGIARRPTSRRPPEQHPGILS